jgi:hypothetical protein
MSEDDELDRALRRLIWDRRGQTGKEHVAPEDLAAYHDRTLPPQRAEEVEEHLAWCPGCVRMLKGLEELDGGLGNLPHAAVPDQRVEASFKAVLAASRRRPWWPLPAAGLAAALLLVGLILPWMLRRPAPSAPGAPIGAAGVPSADMSFSPERSPEIPMTQVHLPAGERLFVLSSWYLPQPESSLLRVTVLDSRSRVAWRSEPFRNVERYHCTLVLARDLLPERRYLVRIEVVGPGAARTLGERILEIIPSRAP